MAAGPDVAAKVAFFLRRAFPRPPTAIETHLSWVFLTPDRAYKLKKPIAMPFLDHRTIGARRADCEAELSLNQELAPGVYLDVVPLTSGGGDELLAIDGEGEIVDWLVVMRRLPAESSLQWRLEQGQDPTDTEIETLVARLVRFYRSAPEPMRPEQFRQRLAATLALDRAELLRPERALDGGSIVQLLDRLEGLVADAPWLSARAELVVDGHGDLRPEHVMLGPEPLVIDRITCDRDLRLVDPFYDLALLAVECDHLGAASLGSLVLEEYGRLSGDDAPPRAVALYRCLRAVTRARLSVAHLRDGDRDAARWLDRTDSYLGIAARWVERCYEGRAVVHDPM